ncbi:MAG: hypothetical protein LBM87_00430 [Ruminococcus sp.]|jgi:hypothetical protein|nr:hypothetical protein [Ruminococcus sp.]
MKKVTKTFTTFILLTALLLTSLATTGLFSTKVTAADTNIYFVNNSGQTLGSMQASTGAVISATVSTDGSYFVKHGSGKDIEVSTSANGLYLNNDYGKGEPVSVSSGLNTYYVRDRATGYRVATLKITGQVPPKVEPDNETFTLKDKNGVAYRTIKKGQTTYVFVPSGGDYLVVSSKSRNIYRSYAGKVVDNNIKDKYGYVGEMINVPSNKGFASAPVTITVCEADKTTLASFKIVNKGSTPGANYTYVVDNATNEIKYVHQIGTTNNVYIGYSGNFTIANTKESNAYINNNLISGNHRPHNVNIVRGSNVIKIINSLNGRTVLDEIVIRSYSAK